VFLLGLAAALAASVLFNVGAALQALEARDSPPARSMHLSLLAYLLRRKLWVLGLVLGIVGIAPQVAAFELAPFVVAQTAITAGLVLLLVLGVRLLDEPVGRPEVVGVIAIVAGIALLAGGSPTHVEAHRGGLAVVAVAAALSLAGVTPFLVRGTRWDTPMHEIVSSGCGFAASNVATKLMSDDVGLHHWPNAAAWAVVVIGTGIAATVTGMTALQRRKATIVVPVSTAVQTFLPIVAEPLFLRERFGDAALDGLPIAAGLATLLVGTVLVSRTRAVTSLATAGAASDPRRAPGPPRREGPPPRPARWQG
jgi:drug/metabolite transporter (DMT)-like permease